MANNTNERNTDMIPGRNPVSEAIRSNRPIDRILVAKGDKTAPSSGFSQEQRKRRSPSKRLTGQSSTISAEALFIRVSSPLLQSRSIAPLTIFLPVRKIERNRLLLLCWMSWRILTTSVLLSGRLNAPVCMVLSYQNGEAQV